MPRKRSLALFAACVPLFGQDQTPRQTTPGQIGYQSAPDAEQRKTLLLKDFQPTSMLHAAVHQVPKAKFYVIDVHNHVNDAARIDEHMPPGRVVEVMNHTNVKTIVILTGMWGDKLQQVPYRAPGRHPRTTFVSLHLANWPENLDYVSSVLDSYPNVMTEFGAREAELGRQPRRAREFFLKYQDRIMFGTDIELTEDMYRNHFRWLETADEYFDYWGYPGQGRWKIYGVELPDPVLQKIYRLNAERAFGGFPGTSAAVKGAR